MDRSADIERNWTRFCECGRAKEHSSYACDACLSLDGETSKDSQLISLLRLNLEMTVDQIAECLGMHNSGVLRSLHVLMKKGRVTRQLRESDGVEAQQRDRYGGGLRTGIRVGTHHVYMLCDRRAAT